MNHKQPQHEHQQSPAAGAGRDRQARLAMISTDPEVEQIWHRCLEQLSIPHAQPLWTRDRYARTYRNEQQVYKICISSYAHSPRETQRLEREYQLLTSLADLPDITRPIALVRTADHVAAIYAYVESQPLDDRTLPTRRVVVAVLRLLAVLARLSARGIAHNDVLAHNVLVRPNGRVVLIDYEKARRVRVWRAVYTNLLRRGTCPPRFYGSLLSLIKHLAIRRVHSSQRQRLEYALNCLYAIEAAWRRMSRAVVRLPRRVP